jgi:two-component system response regulator FixJ
MNPSRPVLVVDDDAAARESLALLLESEGHRVLAYATAEALLAAGRAPAAACIVADLRLGDGIGGIELMRRLRRSAVDTPFVLLTGHGDVPLAVAAMREGAHDFLEKPAPPAVLLDTLRAAIARADAGGQRRGAAGDMLARLTAREREVLRGLVAGRSNKEVAQALGISPRTVEAYRAGIMDKLGLAGFAELVRFGLAAGLGD